MSKADSKSQVKFMSAMFKGKDDESYDRKEM